MKKEIYKPTPKEEKAAQEAMTISQGFDSKHREKTYSGGNFVQISPEFGISIKIDGNKIYLGKDMVVLDRRGVLPGRESESKSISPKEAIQELELGEVSVRRDMERLQRILDDISTMKKRIIDMKGNQLKEE